MSEFMLILPGGERPMFPPTPGPANPETILRRLLVCLTDLDCVDARLAAAHMDSAIHHFRVQFDLEQDSSETD